LQLVDDKNNTVSKKCALKVKARSSESADSASGPIKFAWRIFHFNLQCILYYRNLRKTGRWHGCFVIR